MSFRRASAYSLITLVVLSILGSIFFLSQRKEGFEHPKKYSKGEWVAFGEMRSHIEPCGCNPDTDLGGVRRVYQAINTEITSMNSGKAPAIFVLGNMINSSAPLQKSKYIDSLLKDLDISAYLVNQLELNNLSSLASPSNIPYVLTNLKESRKQIAKSIPLGAARVFGYTSADDSSTGLLFDAGALLDRVKKIGSTENILLFSGSEEDLQFIASSGVFETIVSANDRVMGAEPDQMEVTNLGLLHWFGDIYKVPVFAQGILLGDALRETKPEADASSFGEQQSKIGTQTHTLADLVDDQKFVLWLGKEFEKSNAMDEAYNLYQSKQGGAFAEWSESRKANYQNSRYAGAQACKSCHGEAFKIWEESSHHHAIATLQAKNKDKDLDCISCHVLGFKDDDGYVSEEISPNFANVQCENCHGPAKEHALNPTQKPEGDAKGVCVSCHHTPHSSNFVYSEYWEKIKHGKESLD